LIHFGSEFGIVGFGEIGINNVDSDSEGFISLRRFATHVDRCMQELFIERLNAGIYLIENGWKIISLELYRKIAFIDY
jgi:hypothetical protein